MKAEEYKEKLEKLYREFYSGSNGYCMHYADCISGMKAKETAHTIACSWSARVGDNYGKYPACPQVLIIGKEDVKAHLELEPPASFSIQKNTHYRGTNDILAALLGVTDAVEKNGRKYKMPIRGTTEKLDTLYALSNQYHCAFKDSGGNQNVPTNDTMWYNCSELLKREIDILQPDIVVIQSGWSIKPGAEKDIQCYFSDGDVKPDMQTAGLFWLYNQQGKKVRCIIGSYHPCYPKWLSGDNEKILNSCIKQARDWFSQMHSVTHKNE